MLPVCLVWIGVCRVVCCVLCVVPGSDVERPVDLQDPLDVQRLLSQPRPVGSAQKHRVSSRHCQGNETQRRRVTDPDLTSIFEEEKSWRQKRLCVCCDSSAAAAGWRGDKAWGLLNSIWYIKETTTQTNNPLRRKDFWNVLHGYIHWFYWVIETRFW